MDVIAEYSARYHGPPDPVMPWLLFTELSKRCAKFDARDWLRAIDGPSYAVASLGSEGKGDRLLLRSELVKQMKA